MIFVDASALLAAQEEDALDLAGVLETDSARLTSPIALRETVAGLCRSHIFLVEPARNRVKGLCDLFGL